jgi:hypothetical protein
MLNKFMLTGVNANDIQVYHPHKKSNAELIRLVQCHNDRLIALLDKPVILAVTWEDNDVTANVIVIPCEGDPDKPFEQFALPFPPK